jgi:hypothetical protein
MKNYIQNKNLITGKFNDRQSKIYFQNIILSVFLAPFILIVYTFILAIKTEFINDKILEMLSNIMIIIVMFSIVGFYLIFFYMSIYIKNRILFKIIKLSSLFLIVTYHAYIIFKKDIQTLTGFDDYFILITSILIAYIIVKAIRNLFLNIFNWIFNSDSYKQDELIKFKLSFIKSIIFGFITFITTVLGIALTIKQLFFT